jgi:hypothetical protein
MASSYYITAEDAELALGRATFVKLFDDNNTKRVNDAAVLACIARASARTTAAMAHNYAGDVPFASPIPEMAQELTHAYFAAFAWPRNTDLMKSVDLSAAKLLASADALAKLLHDAVIRVVDALPNAVPTNVGGAIGAIGGSYAVPNPPESKFANMGDF